MRVPPCFDCGRDLKRIKNGWRCVPCGIRLPLRRKDDPMTPKVGDTVLFKQLSRDVSVGVHVHPAIVTRVWSETCVNLMVLFDGIGAVVKTSVTRGPLDGPDQAWNWRDDNVRALEG